MKPIYKMSALSATLGIILLSACSNMHTSSIGADVDGLSPVPDSKFNKYYRKSGADFSKFRQIGIEPCTVSFRKNWQRDQNLNRAELGNRITQKDMNRITGRMIDSCNAEFRKSIERSADYQFVENYNSGDPVLVLRPSIIDLDVSAPDVRGTGITQSLTKSTGEMTLSLDIVDGATGEVIARVIDRRRDTESYLLERASSVTNQADFDRSLRLWAKRLSEVLGRARP